MDDYCDVQRAVGILLDAYLNGSHRPVGNSWAPRGLGKYAVGHVVARLRPSSAKGLAWGAQARATGAGLVVEAQLEDLILELHEALMALPPPAVVRSCLPQRSAPDYFTYLDNLGPGDPIRMASRLLRRSGGLGLIGAWFHGSVGSREIVDGYSDFDSLVLIRASGLQSRSRLRSLRVLFDQLNTEALCMDPLQHHGIFILTEGDLRGYCQAKFPLELFRHASPNLLHDGVEVSCCIRDDFQDRLQALQRGMETVFALGGGAQLRNAYAVKGFVQTVLLLPALFVQCITGEYQFKKFSYEMARGHFSSQEWRVIEQMSEMRQTWRYRSLMPMWVYRSLGRSGLARLAAAFARLESRKGLESIRDRLGQDWVAGGVLLANAMRRQLAARRLLT